MNTLYKFTFTLVLLKCNIIKKAFKKGYFSIFFIHKALVIYQTYSLLFTLCVFVCLLYLVTFPHGPATQRG